jgi:hypothetical protein
MNADQVIQIAGALSILAAFTLSQANRLEPRSYVYLLCNLIGAAILTVLAWQSQRWGFVLLEGVWSLVALGGLVMRVLGKEPAAGH